MKREGGRGRGGEEGGGVRINMGSKGAEEPRNLLSLF